MKTQWWTDEELTTSLPFYAELNSEAHALLRRSARPVHWRAGQILLDEGAVCHQIAWVLRGAIRVYKLSPDGREVTLYRIGPGDTCLLSAACIINEKPFPAVAETETETDLIALDSLSFQQLLGQSQALQRYILGRSLQRLSNVMEVIDTMAFTRRSTAVAAFLLKKRNETNHPAITITHQQMAAELGTAREVVSRTLKELQDEGILTLSRGRIRVLDADRLADRVKSGI